MMTECQVFCHKRDIYINPTKVRICCSREAEWEDREKRRECRLLPWHGHCAHEPTWAKLDQHDRSPFQQEALIRSYGLPNGSTQKKRNTLWGPKGHWEKESAVDMIKMHCVHINIDMY